jgi:hemoglobin
MEREIRDMNDIKLLVDAFYANVSKDDLLSPIFHGRIADMPQHLQHMYKFWENILLDQSSYDGTSLLKHEHLPLMNQHFVRWLSLFLNTIDQLYSGPTADLAKLRAIRMAEEFQYKLELMRF